MKDNISWAITIIASILTTGTLIYKIFIKKAIEREKKYYEIILKPFIEKCIAEDEQNALREIENQIHHTDEFIPKYIVYLIDEAKKNAESNEVTADNKLIKVLKVDYLDFYPNDEYSLMRLIKFLTKMSNCIILILSFLFLFFGCKSLLDGFVDLFSSNWLWISIYKLLLGILGFVMYFVGICFVLLLDRDRYTIRKSKIEKIINKKVKLYNKKCTKFVY